MEKPESHCGEGNPPVSCSKTGGASRVGNEGKGTGN